jgi:hypothetical protein
MTRKTATATLTSSLPARVWRCAPSVDDFEGPKYAKFADQAWALSRLRKCNKIVWRPRRSPLMASPSGSSPNRGRSHSGRACNDVVQERMSVSTLSSPEPASPLAANPGLRAICLRMSHTVECSHWAADPAGYHLDKGLAESANVRLAEVHDRRCQTATEPPPPGKRSRDAAPK